jgi:enterochelin esterase family protein
MIQSPRIRALASRTLSGDDRALADFWQEVSGATVPLVEPIDGDDERMLVTFVWRGDNPGVALRSGLCGFQMPLMTLLPDSDVWYASFPASRETRTTYQFLPDPPFRTESSHLSGEDYVALALHKAWTPDPRNGKQFDSGAGSGVQSVLEMPDAPPQPWINEHVVPHGRIEPSRFDSEVLGSARVIWTYTPAAFDNTAPAYPLVLLFDGYAYLQMSIRHTLDNLIAAGKIPPVVCAMVHQLDRNVELACDEAFAASMVKELCGAWLPQRYNTTLDPARTVVGGLSLGGLGAAFCGLRYPDRFGHVITQSGAHWWGPGAPIPAYIDNPDVHWEWIIDQFAHSERLPLRWYIDVGSLEVAWRPGVEVDMVGSNRRLRDTLRARHYPLEYAEFPGGHDYVCWRGTIADALVATLGHPAPTATTSAPP